MATAVKEIAITSVFTHLSAGLPYCSPTPTPYHAVRSLNAANVLVDDHKERGVEVQASVP